MIDNATTIKVTNRDNGTLGYSIPDLNNLHRVFQPKESKQISMEELRKLSYLPGGLSVLKNYLIIDSKEAIEELLNGVEPEYYYTEEDVKTILSSGSLDQLLDCLDFAPSGVIEILKDVAVKTELNDIQKRKAIFEKTGFNVTSAIEINHMVAEEEPEPIAATRRTIPVEKKAEPATQRRIVTVSDKK